MDESTKKIESELNAFRSDVARLKQAVHAVIVGQETIVEQVLIAVLAGGHALLEGVPGLGKTLLVRTLSRALDLPFSRIQFTPDLMPADVTGTNIVVEDEHGRRSFAFQAGPIFAGIVLADEINRATPKTQSALLEAMQEATVTVNGRKHDLPDPFFVLATQNPIEMEGTYPLPEAQLDRFLFKLQVEFPDRDSLLEIFARTTGTEVAEVNVVVDAARLRAMRGLARHVLVARQVAEYAARIVLATHPGDATAPSDVARFVRFGASPRGGQSLILAAKVRALMDGRPNVSFADLRELAKPALRHRLILNFEGEAEGKRPDDILDSVLSSVKP